MENARVQVILAHPDDADFSSGGTMAKWVEQGCDIQYVLVTSGAKGNVDPNLSPEDVMSIRRKEQAAAAEILGIKSLVFMEEMDGEVQNNLEFRKKLTRLIREFKPDAIFTHDPWARWRGHPDHYAVGFAVCVGAVLAAGNIMFFPELLKEGLQPHNVPEVYLTGSEEPNIQVDISDTIEKKLKAAKKHVSQIRNEEAMVGRFVARAQAVGAKIGVPMAEEFRVIRLFG